MGVAKPWHERHNYDRRELDEQNENDVHDSQPWYPRHERYTVSSVARTILLVLGLAALGAIGWKDAAAQTIVVTPPSGTVFAPATPTVTWTCPSGALSAVATGNWSGTKAVSGTQTLAAFPAATHNFGISCAVPGVVDGKSVITWINATTNTDGTAIPATCPVGENCGRLLNTKIEYGSCSSTGTPPVFGTKVGEITTAFPGTTVTVSSLVVQTYCFRGFHANDFGMTSPSSNIMTKTIAAPAPVNVSASAAWVVKAPTTPAPPTIAVDQTAYEIKPNSTGTLTATRVGIVPDGTECISATAQKVGSVTYMRVPREKVDLVNWPTNTKLQDVWAKCS